MPDREVAGGSLRQGESQIFYAFNTGTGGRYRLGDRKLTEVSFPALKVFIMEDVDRSTAKTYYPWLHRGANPTVALFDGSVGQRKSVDMNPGSYTNQVGRRAGPASVFYDPRISWGYPLWPGGGQPMDEDDIAGRCRWTYQGLKGRDFGGAEAP
jgi:hypothetical protein